MARARLAALTLTGGLLLLTGCQTSSFDFLHRGSRNNGCNCPTGCDCGEMVVGAPSGCCPSPGCATCPGGYGTGPLISNAHPPIFEGPNLFPPSPSPLVMPGAPLPSGPIVPRPAPLPPVVTVPQATPTPSPP